MDVQNYLTQLTRPRSFVKLKSVFLYSGISFVLSAILTEHFVLKLANIMSSAAECYNVMPRPIV